MSRRLLLCVGAAVMLVAAVLVLFMDAWPMALLLGASGAYLLVRAIRDPAVQADGSPQLPKLSTAIFIAAIILALDLWIGGAPIFSGFTLLVLAFVAAPRVLMARDPALRIARLRNLGVIGAAIAVCIAWFVYDDGLAEQRVLAVAKALKDHRQIRGSYPERLQDLVPGQFSELPIARSYGTGSRIYLFKGESGGPQLMYVQYPPFGRRVLDVESGRWSGLD